MHLLHLYILYYIFIPGQNQQITREERAAALYGGKAATVCLPERSLGQFSPGRQGTVLTGPDRSINRLM